MELEPLEIFDNRLRGFLVKEKEPSDYYHMACVVYAKSSIEACLIALNDSPGLSGRQLRLDDITVEHNNKLPVSGKTKKGVCHDATIQRIAGMAVDGDDSCADCGLYTMDDEFPICESCRLCSGCASHLLLPEFESECGF